MSGQKQDQKPESSKNYPENFSSSKKLLQKILKYILSALRGNEIISDLNFIGWIAYIISFIILDFHILAKINLNFLEKFYSFSALLFFSWHLIAVQRCKPKEPKLSKEEKRQKMLQEQQESGKKFIRKLLLKEPVFKIKDSTFLTVIDFYFLVSCLQKLTI